MGIFRGPRIITDGLVLALDSESVRSYPGSGTTWYDLSSIRNNGTMYGDVSWDGKHMVFGGTNGYVGMGTDYCNDGIIGVGNIDYSMEVWLHQTTLAGTYANCMSVVGNAGSTGIGLQIASSSGNKGNFGYRTNSNFFSTSVIPLDEWIHFVGVKIGFGNSYIYYNGVKDNTFTTTTHLDIDPCSTEMQIGYAATRMLQYYIGKIAVVKLYKIALTDEQVLYNFNTQKNRFGI